MLRTCRHVGGFKAAQLGSDVLSTTGIPSRRKSSLDWPLTAWTRWFTGQTSAVLPLGEPACMVESQPPSFDKVGKQMLTLWVLLPAAQAALGRK